MARIKEQLRQCTENYATFGDSDGIHAISEKDAQIITSLIEIMNKIGIDKNLSKLMESYKIIPDDDFYMLINSYNESFQGSMHDKQVMINIKDQFIGSIEALYSFTRGSYYDSKLKKSTPVLIINKSDNNKTPYANTQIIFASEEELEQEFEKLKIKLSECTKLKFI